MALPTDDLQWVRYLSLLHDSERKELEALDAYYAGTQPLQYLHPEVMREVGDRIKPLVIFWPQLIVDAIEERLDVEGFRLPKEDAADDDLWRVWQANGMDEQTQLGHVDALVMRRYYVTVGSDEDDEDTPILAAESPLEMFADIDPRTRRERAALRRVIVQGDIVRNSERYATLYLPNRTVRYDWRDSNWTEVDVDDHNLGAVPVVPVVNRGRLSGRRDQFGRMMRRLGTSELAPIIPLSDAANKIATDMMLSSEFHAIPLRGFWGIGPEDLKDEHGNPITALQAIMSRFLTLPLPEGGVGEERGREFEFTPATLDNFHRTIEQLSRLASAMAALPPNYFGLAADDAASADAIRSREARLVKRAERKQRAYGGAYEHVQRLVRRFQTGEWDPRLQRLEAIWRDAGTPTVAQVADAAVKKYTTQPRPIVPLRQTREDLGYTDVQIRRMEESDEQEARLDPVGALARGMATTGGQSSAEDGGQEPSGAAS